MNRIPDDPGWSGATAEESALRAELAAASAAHQAALTGTSHPETARFTSARVDNALSALAGYQMDQASAAWVRGCACHHPETGIQPEPPAPPAPEAGL